MIKNVALIGLGAVGATVAQELKTVLNDNLTIIVDKERKLRYQKNGIFINGEKQDFNLVTPEEAKPADLVIIATKNLQVTQALSSIKNAVGTETAILSLLNGIQSESEIEAVYGKEKTLYGFIIDLNSINLNGKIQCDHYGKIVFGEKNNQRTERINQIEELFKASKTDYKIPENIQLDMWKKYLINVCFNSLGALCRSPYGGFANESMQALVRKIGKEVVQVANAEGIALQDQMIEDNIKKNLTYNPLGKCSMLQDVEAGRKTENNWFCGTVVRLGKKHCIETPNCQFIWELIEGTEYAADLTSGKIQIQ